MDCAIASLAKAVSAPLYDFIESKSGAPFSLRAIVCCELAARWILSAGRRFSQRGLFWERAVPEIYTDARYGAIWQKGDKLKVSSR